MSLLEADFEMKVESTEFTGRVRSTTSLSVDGSVSLNEAGLGLSPKVVRVRQHFYPNNLTIYEGYLSFTNSTYAQHVELCGTFTLETLCQQAGIPQPSNASRTPFFINFKGSRWDLIFRVADMTGQRWFLDRNGDVNYFEMNTGSGESGGNCNVEYIIEEGWFGSGHFRGVKYKKRAIETKWVIHRTPLERNNCRIILEPTFKQGVNVYTIANIEFMQRFPYLRVHQVTNVLPPWIFRTQPRGITEQKDSLTKEWDYQLETQEIGTKEIIRGIRCRLRIATEFEKNAADPVMATIDTLWDRYFKQPVDREFKMDMKVDVENVQEVELGSSPYLVIDTSWVPVGFEEAYANKMLYLNTVRTRRISTQVFTEDPQVPELGQSAERVVVQYDGVQGITLVTVEVLS